VLGLVLGMALECLPNRSVNRLRLRRAECDDDAVVDADHARESPHRALRVLALTQEIDLAVEGDPAVGDRGADPLVRHEDVPLEGMPNGDRKLGIAPPQMKWRLNIDVVGDVQHPGDPMSGVLRRELLRIALHRARERHHLVLDGDADLRVVDLAVPRERLEHAVAHGVISHWCDHDVPPSPWRSDFRARWEAARGRQASQR